MVKKVCVLGFGQIGKEWAHAISGLGWVDQMFIIEPNIAINKNIPKNKKVLAYYSLNGIDPNQIDILIDASPPNNHLKNAKWALENGVDLLQEKPVLVSMSELTKLEKLVKNRKSKYSINHLYRDKDWVKYIKKQKIQNINYIELKLVLSAEGHGFRSTMQRPALLDYLIHHLDLIEYITNSKIVAAKIMDFNDRLSKTYQGSAAFVMEFKTDTGVVGSILCTTASSSQQTGWEGDWCFYADSMLCRFNSLDNSLIFSNGKSAVFKEVPWLTQLQNCFVQFIDLKNFPVSVEDNIDLIKRVLKFS